MKTIYTTIMGLPNAGKSTLLNQFCNRKTSIASAKPHTTQVNILAELLYENHDLKFLDTPGMSKKGKKYWATYANHYLFIIDASKKSHSSDLAALKVTHKILLSNFEKDERPPLTIILNKVDRTNKMHLLPLADSLKNYTTNIFMISAKTGEHTKEVLDHIVNNSNSNECYADGKSMNDREFMILEIIREKIFINTRQEIPYTTSIEIENIEEKDGLTSIHVSIIAKKLAHKKIIIGERGSMLKKISQVSRLEIEDILGSAVDLFVNIKIRK